MSPQNFWNDPLDLRRMPSAVKSLLIANTAVFLLGHLARGEFYSLFGLVPQHLIFDRWIWQPFTYLFIHGSVTHLLFNLFALWMFGVPVEAQWGAADFLKYYFLCGLGAAALQVALGPHSTVPVIGASGAIYGILVAFAMLYPDAVVYLYFFIPVKAAYMALIFGAIEFFTGVSGANTGIANFAHLGGMVTGYLYLRWWWVAKIRIKAAFSDVRRGSGLSLRPAAKRSTARKPSASQEEPPMSEIDRILDKILVSGLDSLSEQERATMKRYSERMKH